MSAHKTIDTVFQKVENETEQFIKGVISSPISSQLEACQKIILRPVIVKGGLHISCELLYKKKSITKNIGVHELFSFLKVELQHFKQGLFVFKESEFYLTLIHGSFKVKERRIQSQVSTQLEHNKQKKYIIAEGTPCAFLEELGVTNHQGVCKHEMRDKFLQINHFLALLKPIFDTISKQEECTVVDFGCGKSYLTFAMYYYLNIIEQKKVTIVGIDLKEDVLNECQILAVKLGYEKLQFSSQSIETFHTDNPLALVVALHACDTATDYAMYKAVTSHAKAIACAPCCQHEVFSQFANDKLPVVLEHGILKERVSALFTDAMRAELLEIVGYKTDVIEFIDAGHTPKNILIRAVKRATQDPRMRMHKIKRYENFVSTFGIEPLLGRLLKKEHMLE